MLARMIALAAAFAVLGLAGPARAQEPPGPLRVYVVVLDGLKPSEVGPLTPNLSALRAQGTWYEQARAVFPAETLPNHVAMATGVLPSRNGIIGNQYWHPNEFTASAYYMEQPELLEADTIVTRLENSCGAISTATVQSKTYLHGVFRGEAPRPDDPNPQREADFHWRPSPVIPLSNHAPDASTMDAFLTWIEARPPDKPQYAFVNLGDIDRAGHVDEVGGTTFGATTPARQAAIEDTDGQIGLLIDQLVESGAWDDTALLFVSDHSMDWSPVDRRVSAQGPLTNAGYQVDFLGAPGDSGGGQGDFVHVGGGGTGAVYVEDPADIPDMARILDAQPGVSFVATAVPVPGLGNPTLDSIGLEHPNNGDIVMVVEPGWHVADGNDLPGNHGHPVTQPSVLFAAGGHPVLRDQPASIGGEAVYDPATKLFSRPEGGPGNLSVAPTVAALFGLGQPAGGYDGSALGEAFEPYALMAHTPCAAAQPGYPRPRGATPLRVPLVPAYQPCTEPNRRHGPPLAHPSCAPPRRESSDLTIGTPDSNGHAANSTGFARLAVMPGDPGTPEDETDVSFEFSMTDVRHAGDLSDYTGGLLLSAEVRVTDRQNGDAGDEPATVVDFPFPALAPCGSTASASTGGACSLATSFDAILPGVAAEGKRAVWQLGALEVLDGGPDGDPRTHPNSLFARQGVFVP